MRYLRSTSVPAPYISVTPDASPNVFEEPESNMKSMPPRYLGSLLSVEYPVFGGRKTAGKEWSRSSLVHPSGRTLSQLCLTIRA